jgi:hypothetical protein
MELQEVLTFALEAAKKNLIASGDLLPVALMFNKEGDLQTVMPMPFKNPEEKYRAMTVAGCFARKMGADILVTVCDAAMREFKSEEDAKYMEEHYDTERPLAQPKCLRTECLVAQAFEFPSKVSLTSILPYTGEHPNYTFEEISEPAQCEGAISDVIREGWDHINAAIESGELKEGVEDMIQNGMIRPMNPPPRTETETGSPLPAFKPEEIYKAEVKPIQRN